MRDFVVAYLVYRLRYVILFVVLALVGYHYVKEHFWEVVMWALAIASGFGICYLLDYLRGRRSSRSSGTSTKNDQP